jgi:hypothetical protein
MEESMNKYVGPVTWYEFPQLENAKLDEWMCWAGISDSGVVYVPGAIAGNPNAVLLCAGYDGVQALLHENNVYYPTTWLAQEYPATREALEKLERKLKAANAE